MTNLLRSKRANNMNNYLIVIIFLFIFGIASIIGGLITFAIIDGFQASPFWDDNMAKAASGFTGFIGMLDYVTVAFVALFIIGSAVTAYRLPAKPAAYIITFLLAPIYGFISYFMNHIFLSIVSQDVFNVIVLTFPRTIMLLTNLHWIVLAMILVGAVALYAKREPAQGEYLR